MEKKAKGASCCGPSGKGFAGCRVESLIAVDDRGQMVLPKELRDRAGIKGGDKLAVIGWEKGGESMLPLPGQGGRVQRDGQGSARPPDGGSAPERVKEDKGHGREQDP